jgi:hypothetical protein
MSQDPNKPAGGPGDETSEQDAGLTWAKRLMYLMFLSGIRFPFLPPAFAFLPRGLCFPSGPGFAFLTSALLFFRLSPE